MNTLQDFIDAFAEEVGPDLAAMVSPSAIGRWVNRAQARLGIYRGLRATVTWSVGDSIVTLPTDFYKHEELHGDGVANLPNHRWWGGHLRFNDPATVAGTMTMDYYAMYPKITMSSDSALPDVGDDACVSYCLYRFYKRLASSRADYRRYATITATNGVDISELNQLSETHFSDFDDARQQLLESDAVPANYFED